MRRRAALELKRGERRDADEFVDSEVPAAVVCARCGEADCPGFCHDESRSGVVAVVPWERPGSTAFARLWATARATTFDAERFFESLPDGSLTPALRFAVISELIASAAMTALAVVPMALFAPGWIRHVLTDELGRALRLAAVGVPLVAGLLVVAHAAHGWALDWGARGSGARRATRRALRFGLYAAGWDLVIGPVGAVVLGLRQGASAVAGIAGVAIGLPGRSARAFLLGSYRLEGPAARPALRASYAVAAIATLVGSVAVVAALIAALFL